jgi:hypothetical protein
MKVGKLLATFLAVIFVFLVFTMPYRYLFSEGFAETMYGAKKNKPRGAPCKFDPECASNTCNAYSSSEGPRFTCH